MTQHTWVIHLSVATGYRYTDAEMEEMAFKARDALLLASHHKDDSIDAFVEDCEEV